MTLLSIFSIKGAPGVTTLACLLGAAWPEPGAVAVVEADPAGGDLAARFGLSVHRGWSSLISSTRRSEEAPSLDPHLQELPGGLPVLVASRRCRATGGRQPRGQGRPVRTDGHRWGVRRRGWTHRRRPRQARGG